MPSVNRTALNTSVRSTEKALDNAREALPDAAGRAAATLTKNAVKLIGPGVEVAGGVLVAQKTIPYTVDAAMGKDVYGFNPQFSTADRVAATGIYGVASAVALLGIAHGSVKALRILTDGNKKTEAASAAD
jgi:hypothetical protein